MGELTGRTTSSSASGAAIQQAMSLVLVVMFLPAVLPLPATQASMVAGAGGGILHIPSATSLAHCPSTCGDVNISYPFGIGPGCFRQGFELTCDDSASPPTLFLGKTAAQITELYDTLAIIIPMAFNITVAVGHSGTNTTNSMSLLEWQAPGKGITMNSMNILFLVGCDFSVSLFDRARNLVGSCSSRCHGDKVLPITGPCNGTGCCFIRLTHDMTGFLAAVVRDDHCMATAAAAHKSEPDDQHPRVKAFMSIDPRYMENATHLFSIWRIDDGATKIYGAELDIAITDQPSCQSALMNRATYACAAGSKCRDAPYGGYYCECSSYDYFDPVKPYLLEGCAMPGSEALGVYRI